MKKYIFGRWQLVVMDDHAMLHNPPMRLSGQDLFDLWHVLNTRILDEIEER